MLPKIQENLRYIQDIKKFLKAVDLVENESIKNEAMSVLKKLQNEAKRLDNSNNDIYTLKQNFNTNKSNVFKENLVAHRKKLEKLLARYFE